jgi:hypothetical protein
MKLIRKTRPQLPANHIDAKSLDLKRPEITLIQKYVGVGIRRSRAVQLQIKEAADAQL